MRRWPLIDTDPPDASWRFPRFASTTRSCNEKASRMPAKRVAAHAACSQGDLVKEMRYRMFDIHTDEVCDNRSWSRDWIAGIRSSLYETITLSSARQICGILSLSRSLEHFIYACRARRVTVLCGAYWLASTATREWEAWLQRKTDNLEKYNRMHSNVIKDANTDPLLFKPLTCLC